MYVDESSLVSINEDERKKFAALEIRRGLLEKAGYSFVATGGVWQCSLSRDLAVQPRHEATQKKECPSSAAKPARSAADAAECSSSTAKHACVANAPTGEHGFIEVADLPEALQSR